MSNFEYKIGTVVGVWDPNDQRLRPATVLHSNCNYESGDRLVYVRLLGRTKRGRRHPAFWRHENYIRPIVLHDSIHAAIFADWLEDHDQPKAAELLRDAFPLEE